MGKICRAAIYVCADTKCAREQAINGIWLRCFALILVEAGMLCYFLGLLICKSTKVKIIVHWFLWMGAVHGVLQYFNIQCMCRSSASRNNYVARLRASFDQSQERSHTHSCVAVYSASITRTIITCAINCSPVMGILPRELPN